jgi:hypothetical protein
MTIPSGIVWVFATLGHIPDAEVPIDPIEDARPPPAGVEEPVAMGMVADPEGVAGPAADPAAVGVPNSAMAARATTEAVPTEAAAAHHRRDASRSDAHFETNRFALSSMTVTLPLW